MLPNSILERYKACFKFETDEKDEIPLEEEDIVLVAQKFEDGWVRGIRMREMLVGYCPMCLLKSDYPPVLKSDLSGDEQTKERDRMIRMLYYSEEKYLAQLKIMVEYYIPTLSHLTHPEFTNIIEELGEFSQLLDLSKTLFKSIQSRVAGWNTTCTLISDIFSNMFDKLFKEKYENIAKIEPKALFALLKIKQKDKLKKFFDPIESTVPEQYLIPDRLDLLSSRLNIIIEAPLNQLTRYNQVMRFLNERTPQDHDDCLGIRIVAQKLEELTRNAQVSQKKAQNLLKLEEICSHFKEDVMIMKSRATFKRGSTSTVRKSRRLSDLFSKPNKEFELKIQMIQMLERLNDDKLYADFASVYDVMHDHTYVCEGVMIVTNENLNNVECYVYLFEDLLLINQTTGGNFYRLIDRVNLCQAWITDIVKGVETTDSFLIGTPQNQYTMRVSSKRKQNELRNQWLKAIKARISDQKRKFERLLSLLTVPLSTFYSFSAVCKLMFLKMSNYELNVKANDKIDVFCIFDQKEQKFKPGLHSGERYQDPSIFWVYAKKGNKQGWLPRGYVELPGDGQYYSASQVKPILWEYVVQMKKSLLTISEPGLQENDDKTVCFEYKDEKKEINVQAGNTVLDLVDKFSEGSDRQYDRVVVRWYLTEVSSDGYKRKLEQDEDISSTINFWGLNKPNMKFVLTNTVANN